MMEPWDVPDSFTVAILATGVGDWTMAAVVALPSLGGDAEVTDTTGVVEDEGADCEVFTAFEAGYIPQGLNHDI